MDPHVSIVIPTYNAARYVRAAIDSALGQRNVTTEIIVIDDGSRDDTWRILESYGNRILCRRVEHGGHYAARNFGASLARAPWIACLDADDEWLPDKLAAQLAAADDGTALVYTNCRNIGDVRLIKPLQSDNTRLHEGLVFEMLLLGNFITHSSVMIRRDWFQRLNGYAVNGRGAQDWDLWLRLAAAGGFVKLCPQPLTLYRHHHGQMTRQLAERLDDRLSVLKSALSLPAASKVGWPVRRQSFASAWEVSAIWSADCNPGQALWCYLQSARMWPFRGYTYRQILKCCLKALVNSRKSKPGEGWSSEMPPRAAGSGQD